MIKVNKEKYEVEEDAEVSCSTCNDAMLDMQSTYCGTFCAACLADHCEECDVCARDFK